MKVKIVIISLFLLLSCRDNVNNWEKVLKNNIQKNEGYVIISENEKPFFALKFIYENGIVKLYESKVFIVNNTQLENFSGITFLSKPFNDENVVRLKSVSFIEKRQTESVKISVIFNGDMEFKFQAGLVKHDLEDMSLVIIISLSNLYELEIIQ